jgi:threonyl-tRNA synthetase
MSEEKAQETPDHRKIGLEQDLFFFDETSPGSCFFLPKGTHIYKKLQSFIQDEYKKRGYQEVMTPMIAKKDLWEISGHWEKYQKNMFCFDCDNTEYAMKAMNCPMHCLMFKHRVRSYRDLPLRFADFGSLHRNELSGALSKMNRLRNFHQDDAHCFCMHSQIKEEIKNCLDFLTTVYSKFGFKFNVELSTRPEEFIGEQETWDKAESQLKEVLQEWRGDDWTIDVGGGAFYGPKIDIHLYDSLKRKNQCATIQLDFNLPKRFELKVWNDKSMHETPVMIHRAIYGSFERFISILCEHYNGKWPLWLSPNQVCVLPVSEKNNEYVLKLHKSFQDLGFNTGTNMSNDPLKQKIKEAELNHYNYIVVIGQKEEDNNTVTYRKEGKLVIISLKDFIEIIKDDVAKFR